jgi:hypothetical protein
MSHGSGFIPRRFVLGQFATAEALLEGTAQMRAKGHKKIDTHSPYPIHGLEKALGLGRPKIPLIVLLGGLTGACVAYAMMYYMNAYDFPINVANRPPHSPILNIPITFELSVLLGGTSAFLGTLGLAKLPEPYHPLFEAESFRRASIDGFFCSVEVPRGEDPSAALADMQAVGSTEAQIVEESER